MKPLNKKGYDLKSMAPVAIGFVVAAVIISIGATILGDVRDTQVPISGLGCNKTAGIYSNCTASANATLQGLQSMGTFSGWLPTIAIVVAAAIVIGILLTYFAIKQ